MNKGYRRYFADDDKIEGQAVVMWSSEAIFEIEVDLSESYDI
jgi:hypothetical protein